uniref:Uncharacterized protein n=1 Tax=Cacopsylla melanoneura TaxID=428564 RepID=A0A8D8V4L4_9HEMI
MENSSNIIESHVIDGEIDSSNIIESHVIDGEIDANSIIESNVIHVFDETTSEHCQAYFVVQSSTGGGLTEVQVIRNDGYVGYSAENLEQGVLEAETVRFEQTVDSSEHLEHDQLDEPNRGLEENS